jgi:DNA-binding NtrC family response regulator
MSGRHTILIVDDEEELCSSLAEILTAQGYTALFTTRPGETEGILARESVDLVVMDVRMPGIGGVDLLKQLRESHDDLPVIMISGYGSIESVTRCMKYGALNFFKKPIDIPALLAEIGDYLDKQKPKRDQGNCPEYSMATRNPLMEKVYYMVRTAAPTPASVIITGESGTGKERVAMMIHELSQRKSKPFVKINCAAIPDNLLESELFGYEAGAFTDARNRKQGKFELAHGGSIFFDEIGDMSLGTQAKLLRVLQEREFERLGGTQTLPADVRVIAATNKDFEEQIAAGRFRDDLYYRISVIHIRLPALRERKEDIDSLSLCLLDWYARFYNKTILGFSPEVTALFLNHDWPGNIRELKNAIERAVIFCQGEWVEVSDLGLQYQKISVEVPGGYEPETLLENLNRVVIEDALRKTGGSRQEAARLLNIHRKTLYNRMKKYQIGEGE